MRGFFGLFGFLRWIVPFAMLGIGYYVPVLREPVEWPPSDQLWAALFVSLGVMALWLIAEIFTVASRYTHSAQLQIDGFLSLVVVIVITYIAGFYGEAIEWFIVVPWIGAILDALLTGLLGINNAAQKPFAPHESWSSGPPR